MISKVTCPSCEQEFYTSQREHFCSKCNQLTWKLRSKHSRENLGGMIDINSAVRIGEHLTKVRKCGVLTKEKCREIITVLGLPPWGILDKGEEIILDDLFD